MAEEHSAKITGGDSALSGGIPTRMRCGFEMRYGDGLEVRRYAGFEVRITGGIHANTQIGHEETFHRRTDHRVAVICPDRFGQAA